MVQTYQQALNKTLEATGWDIHAMLVKDAPTDQNPLRTRINFSVNDNVLDIRMMPYALYVEYGTAGQLSGQISTVEGITVNIPANPDRKMPVKKVGDEFVSYLQGWAKRQLGSEDDGFALAKHIQLYGTHPHPFIRPILYDKMIAAFVKNWNIHMVDIDISTIGEAS